ncbi:response regulator transcription factor [Synechococcus sp. PCC 7336]|uniref:response regulator n=1 Tax=Synechococcus sp. PCC 7336 TaxID=195250 RepID=UPI000345854D|nr:response regulator transcription factor [Synechococcus sp. PCC 7336]
MADSLDASVGVVVVEDSAYTRAVLRAALEPAEGINLLAESTTAQEGLEAIARHCPEIAILNIGLPDMDGIELTRQVKAALPETRVLILTGSDREETVLAAFGAGADAYCCKDVSADKLLDALQQMQEGNAWIDPAIAHIVLDGLRESGATEPDKIEIAAADAELAEMLETWPLTERELEVLEKIVDGRSNADIGEILGIGLGTVKTHVRNILNKLCANDRTQAAVRALRAGLVK